MLRAAQVDGDRQIGLLVVDRVCRVIDSACLNSVDGPYQ